MPSPSRDLLTPDALSLLLTIEETAEQIAAGDLSARLENFEPDTEVGRLSTSLNIMDAPP